MSFSEKYKASFTRIISSDKIAEEMKGETDLVVLYDNANKVWVYIPGDANSNKYVMTLSQKRNPKFSPFLLYEGIAGLDKAPAGTLLGRKLNELIASSFSIEEQIKRLDSILLG
jgi:hypothetical protein